MSGLVDGATFALDAASHVEAVWGDGSRVLWAQGEPTMIAKPDGVGGTTIAQQLALRRAGIGAPALLGHTVTVDPGRVFYLALDRPRQARRSMRRMVTEDDRDALEEKLVVWEGALPFDIVADPARLLGLAQERDATTVVIDCLKDVAPKLSDEQVGQAINNAMQLCVAAGVEKPRTLDDVYGSRWLRAGCGSVMMLWGEAGDPIVELAHLKQPADEVGPLTLLHDNVNGTTTVSGATDVVDVLGASVAALTARDVASRLFKRAEPNASIPSPARRLSGLSPQGCTPRVHGGARRGCTGRVHVGPYVVGPRTPRRTVGLRRGTRRMSEPTGTRVRSSPRP
jgi:replicative DNA helicase